MSDLSDRVYEAVRSYGRLMLFSMVVYLVRSQEPGFDPNRFDPHDEKIHEIIYRLVRQGCVEMLQPAFRGSTPFVRVRK